MHVYVYSILQYKHLKQLSFGKYDVKIIEEIVLVVTAELHGHIL